MASQKTVLIFEDRECKANREELEQLLENSQFSLSSDWNAYDTGRIDGDPAFEKAIEFCRNTHQHGIAIFDLNLNVNLPANFTFEESELELVGKFEDECTLRSDFLNHAFGKKQQGLLLAILLIANVNADFDIAFASRNSDASELAIKFFQKWIAPKNNSHSIREISNDDDDNQTVSYFDNAIKAYLKFREVPADFCSLWWPANMDEEFKVGHNIPHSFPGKWSTSGKQNQKLGDHLSSIGISEAVCQQLASQENSVGRSIWECLKMIFGAKAGCQHPNGDGEDVPMGVVLLSALAAIPDAQIEKISFADDSASVEKKTNTPPDSYRKCVKAFYELFFILRQEEHTLHGDCTHLPRFTFEVFRDCIRVLVDIDGNLSNKPRGMSLLDCLNAIRNGEVNPCGELTKQISVVLSLCRDVDILGDSIESESGMATELRFTLTS